MGYNYRYNKGKLGGQDLWSQIVAGTIYIKRDINGKIVGKIDIVAHSMGYAYAQGMIDELKKHLAPGNTFGRFYILAPENACSGNTFNKNLFEEVWQYGTNESEDACWRSDGIAPQCPVPGLDWTPSNGLNGLPCYGRIQFPTTGVYAKYRNFYHAHYGASYEWVLKIKDKGNGYVKPR